MTAVATSLIGPDLVGALPEPGEVLELGLGRLLPLDDPSRVWQLQSGSAELYFVEPARDGSASGRRTFLCEAVSGDILCGIASSGVEGRLVAVGLDARLACWSREHFTALLESPAHREQMAARVERWTTSLVAQAAREMPVARSRTVEDDAPVIVSVGDVVFPRSGVAWVSPVDGEWHYLDIPSIAPRTGHTVPISRQLWMRAVSEGGKLHSRSTLGLFEEGSAAAALEHFHEFALPLLAAHVRERRDAESRQVHAREAVDAGSLQRSLDQLTGVLTPAAATRPRATTADPLLAACQDLGEILGVRIVAPRTRGPVTLLDILRTSRVRVRRVTLRGEWWKNDGGSLLGFIDDDRPVSIRQSGTGAYTVFDPVTGELLPVDAGVAARVRPIGFVLFAPAPARAIDLRGLVALTVRGLAIDGWRLLAASIAVGLLGMVTPIVSRVLFDDVIPGADRGQLAHMIMLLVCFALVVAGFELVRSLTLLRIEARAQLNVESAMMDRLLRLPATFFKTYGVGDLASRVMGIGQIRRMLTGNALTAVLSGVFSLGNLALLFVYDTRLALVGTGIALVVSVAIVTCTWLTLRHSRSMTERQGESSTLVSQLMSGIAKIRVAGAERRAFSVWASKAAEQREVAYRVGTIQNVVEVLNATFPLLTSIVFFAAIYLLTSGASTPSAGTFAAITAAFGQFLGSTLGLGLALVSTLQVVPLYERAKPIFEAAPEVRDDHADPGTLTGAIEVSHASFRYEAGGPLILDDVSIHAAPGEMIALVGPSGSGKSTLFRMLLGLERPDSGSVHFDGRDLAFLDVERVRRQFGVVLQHGRLSTGELLTNIIGESSSLTIEDAWEAARMAGLDDDIRQMPMGMQTVVGEGGGTFSGGQRQRLLIARAIVHKPRIILFDEATSALDNHTQQVVSDSLERLQATRIVIAHRLSTVMHADRIYVMQGGRVAEMGTYDELMAQDGVFAAMARRQLVESQ